MPATTVTRNDKVEPVEGRIMNDEIAALVAAAARPSPGTRCVPWLNRIRHQSFAQPWHNHYARFIHVIESCSTVAMETQTK